MINTKVSQETKKGNLLQDGLLVSSVELATLRTNEIWTNLNIILGVISSRIKSKTNKKL
jgi:hypothetical protein